MLKITIPKLENFWNEGTEQFENFEGCEMHLEHSLWTISEWEKVIKKPFVGEKHTNEELLFYIKCMCINDVPDVAFSYLTEEDIIRINEYIQDDQTATTIRDNLLDEKNTKGGKQEFITSELLYYFMIAMNIPVEFEHWHLGRLLMLIRVCSEKNKEAEEKAKNHGKRGNRLSTKEQANLAARYHEINAKRRAEWGTKG
jgi:hypothetical protein